MSLHIIARNRLGRLPAAASAPSGPMGAASRRDVLAAVSACCAAGVFGAIGMPRAARAITPGAARPLHARLDAAAGAIEARMIEWRRAIHRNPELGNQETRTAGLV